jgi:hypothetical protein
MSLKMCVTLKLDCFICVQATREKIISIALMQLARQGNKMWNLQRLRIP